MDDQKDKQNLKSVFPELAKILEKTQRKLIESHPYLFQPEDIARYNAKQTTETPISTQTNSPSLLPRLVAQSQLEDLKSKFVLTQTQLAKLVAENDMVPKNCKFKENIAERS